MTDTFDAQLGVSEVNAIKAYKEALVVIGVTEPGSYLHQEARKSEERFETANVTFMIKCMLCPTVMPYKTTVAEAAKFIYPPRGICGLHDDPVITDKVEHETVGGS